MSDIADIPTMDEMDEFLNTSGSNVAACVAMMKRLHGTGDTEIAHCYADHILCAVLDAHGFGELVKAWKAVGKWYA